MLMLHYHLLLRHFFLPIYITYDNNITKLLQISSVPGLSTLMMRWCDAEWRRKWIGNYVKVYVLNFLTLLSMSPHNLENFSGCIAAASWNCSYVGTQEREKLRKYFIDFVLSFLPFFFFLLHIARVAMKFAEYDLSTTFWWTPTLISSLSLVPFCLVQYWK